MRKTFLCDDSIIITIPIGSLKDAREGQLMPEKFNCVFKDFYKVLVLKGKPKPIGAAQVTAGVFLFMIGLISRAAMMYTLPSVLFVITGMVSFAAGQYPNIHVAKISFSLNIISFFWSVVAFSLCAIQFLEENKTTTEVIKGINGLMMGLLVVENLITLFSIYWFSKAVCRQHFNTLPTILLKQED
ncbi:uncharacterized protein [Embiotoca jacksoni]|uniref:uncharacterized protein n=1 Tax=Embiotoca jacksoni TaxID=100190 RepID=UPI0037047E02